MLAIQQNDPSIHLSYLSIYLRTYLPTYLPTYLFFFVILRAAAFHYCGQIFYKPQWNQPDER